MEGIRGDRHRPRFSLRVELVMNWANPGPRTRINVCCNGFDPERNLRADVAGTYGEGVAELVPRDPFGSCDLVSVSR